MLAFDSVCVAVMTALSAAIHECGHLIFAPPSKDATLPRADISGFRIKIDGMSYKEELIAAVGGPLANILLGTAILFFCRNSAPESYANIFGIINILTALSNLLPIEGYDGYKIIYCACALIFDDATRCESVLTAISFALSALMCFFALYLILKVGEGYWIFGIFFTVTLSAIVRRRKDIF